MRSVGARLALALAVSMLAVDTASATPVSGSITRVGGNVVRVTLTNTGSSDDIAVAVEFHPPVSVVVASRISGPPGNCAPDGDQPNRVLCLLDPPGLAPGQSIVIEVLTNPRVEDNAGANAFSCGIPCNTSMMSGPYPIPGPTPPPPEGAVADLGVTLARVAPRDIAPIPAAGTRAAFLTFETALANHGPSRAQNVRMDVEILEAPDGTRPVVETFSFSDFTCSDFTAGRPRTSRCDFGSRDRGPIEEVTTLVLVQFPEPLRLKVSAISDTPEPVPNPNPNEAELSMTIPEIPDTSGGAIGDFARILGGRAVAAREVAVSLAQVQGGASPAPVPVTGTRHARASATAACRWLTSKRVRFRRQRGRRCDDPSYLRAKVRRGRWKIKLRKSLPPGRYVMVTHGIGAEGLVEAFARGRGGNVRKLRVKKR